MKKVLTAVVFFMFVASMSMASEKELIISQKDGIYADLSSMAKAGLIRSATQDYFTSNAITRFEAASYIKEAASNISLTAGATGQETAAFEKMLKKYSARFSDELAQAQNNKTTAPAAKAPDKELESLKSGLDELEQQNKYTTYTDASPFKVTGVIAGRWQELEGFGAMPIHISAMDGSNLLLYLEGDLTDKIKFTSNLTFEMPSNDPTFGTPSSILSYYGNVKSISPDVYAISMSIYDWVLTTGVFWEDITYFIAAQGQTQRIGIFDRDIYASEETTEAHFEYIFRNYFQNRDERWSKHVWNGFEIYRSGLFGRDIIKVMEGKSVYNTNYLYEYAGRYTHFMNLPGLTGGEWSVNFYNTSNEKSEVAGLSTASDPNPESELQAINILGGDIKATALNTFKINTEFERSRYAGYMTITASPTLNIPYFVQEGNAFFMKLSPVFLPKQVSLDLKYTRIDPDYVAPASSVYDTSYRGIDAGKVDVKSITYAADPTALYNNESKAEASAFVNIPNGLMMLNYGVSAQIRETGNMFQSNHWLLDNVYWEGLGSNYGYLGTQFTAFQNYNLNRYGMTPGSANTIRDADIIAAGKGGLATDATNSNTEYMVSSDVDMNTIKYLDNIMILFRYELNKLIHHNKTLYLELYGELITLSNTADAMVTYDPTKLLSQNMMSACLIYNIIPKMNLIGYAAYERWASASVTKWISATEVIPQPIDYFDTVYGIGADYDLAGRAFLYLRVKKFMHDDNVVTANSFNGWQYWVELKSFF